jgi:uncharacterized protein YaaN involved in tellurite resistance
MEKTPTLEIDALTADQVMQKKAFVYEEARPAEQKAIDEMLAVLDVGDTYSILSFGSHAQEQLTLTSNKIHERIQAKDIGPASQALASMAAVLREFNIQGLDSYETPDFFSRLLGNKAEPVNRFISQYKDVSQQLGPIASALEEQKTSFLADTILLDRLYDDSLEHSHRIELYISAASGRLRQLDEQDIPEMQHKADCSEDILFAQELYDLQGRRGDLDGRIHDLRLSSQAVKKSMSSLCVYQENGEMLVDKLTYTLVNTLPLWRKQFASAVKVYQSGNENVDIASLKEANDVLMATIEEGLQIAEQGKQNQQKALLQLQSTAKELHAALNASKARSQEVAGGATVEMNAED